VNAVLAATRARKVSMVGHSQSGMMPRHYVNFVFGADEGRRLVGRAGSPFLRHLNAGDETPGAVSYTVIQTRYDEVVTPYTSAFLAGGASTANVLLQDACPGHVIDHHFMPHDRLAIRWALQALGRRGPADPAHPASCV
jgi:triacylglycerol lipase